MRQILNGLHSRYAPPVVEQAAIAGALSPSVAENRGEAEVMADRIAKALDAVAEETERGWIGEADGEGGYRFQRTVRGVQEFRRWMPASSSRPTRSR